MFFYRSWATFIQSVNFLVQFIILIEYFQTIDVIHFEWYLNCIIFLFPLDASELPVTWRVLMILKKKFKNYKQKNICFENKYIILPQLIFPQFIAYC